MLKNIRFSERCGRLQSSAIRNKLFDSPDIITFAAGKPEANMFPYEQLIDIAAETLRSNGRFALQYSDTEGIEKLRRLIAEQRMAAWGVQVPYQNITLTSGSQEGIELSAKIFVDEGSTIVCENPSYLGAYNAFQPYHPKYAPVEMDENGMRMDCLEDILKNTPDVRMIYTIPDFQNPTGVTMSDERRKTLAELAARYCVPVVEDRPYSDLCYDGAPHPSVKSFDKEGWVVTLGSFSKIFCPGFRLAWICADETILKKYIMAKQSTNLQCSTLDEQLLTTYMETHSLQTHIENLIALYRKRRDTIVQSLETYMPDEVKFNRPQGGFFTWLELKPEIDTSKLMLDAAEHAKVAFVPGAPFFANGGGTNFLRLNFSFINEQQIEEGIRRFGKLLREKYYC